MRLYLVRHAEAAPGKPDALRSLTAEGRVTARAVADELAPRSVDAVVSSPLLRARETAELIARACGVVLQTDDRLAPGAVLEDLRAAVTGRGQTVVAVGHNPDCAGIVLALTGRAAQFPPGAYRELEL